MSTTKRETSRGALLAAGCWATKATRCSWGISGWVPTQPQTGRRSREQTVSGSA